ncbi:hypothetical protein LX32DRAFT_518 [Colletotrichum zoysiae]|uniref:Uncharacterized protein n=1 Tax=Colletotrichum zoysiae TaxID=1216348 RepID=A0AAD9M5J4_9PEZI|nr:hypothetical protein LX32DRAFT_518 [Colletotrichum zoysiae]
MLSPLDALLLTPSQSAGQPVHVRWPETPTTRQASRAGICVGFEMAQQTKTLAGVKGWWEGVADFNSPAGVVSKSGPDTRFSVTTRNSRAGPVTTTNSIRARWKGLFFYSALARAGREGGGAGEGTLCFLSRGRTLCGRLSR